VKVRLLTGVAKLSVKEAGTLPVFIWVKKFWLTVGATAFPS